MIQESDLNSCPDPVSKYLIKSGVIGKNRKTFARILHSGEFPLVFISVLDEYKDGMGRSLVKLESIFTIADQTGSQIGESSLGRLLIELILTPTALVPTQQLQWESIDSNQARVKLKNKGFAVEAVFQFDNEGLPKKTTIDRFGNFDGKIQKKPFVCEFSSYQVFEGLLIPTAIVGGWQLQDEQFDWFNFKIESVHYE